MEVINNIENDKSTPEDRSEAPPPLQFGISTLLWLAVAVGLIFGTLKWMRVSTLTSLVIMAVLAVCGFAVVLLVAAIIKVDDED
jgi:hypothetical protein